MKNILSIENMRQSDAYTCEHKVSSRELMFRAGKAVYDAVTWTYPAAIVCGSGNNAGDGYVIAKLMHDENKDVSIILTSEKFSGDGQYYYYKCVDSGIKILNLAKEDVLCDFSCYSTVVDCIFGTGFRSIPSADMADVIEKINASAAFVVSVDINSGLNGDTGLSTVCVNSDITVSIGGLKPGLIINEAKDHIKKLINVDIGIEPIEKPYRLVEREDIKTLLKKRLNFSNKGNYGYTALIGGCTEYSGAVKLANLALSALRSGTGVVKLAVPKSISSSVMPFLLESTLFPMPDSDGQIVFDSKAIDDCLRETRVCGVGIGIGKSDEVKKMLEYILEKYEKILIVDADGLNVLSEIEEKKIKNAKCRLILTPHLKEFSRLTGKSVEEIQMSPIEITKEYSIKVNSIVLLKGPGTIITDGKDVFVVNRGCPGMATAGSGDVLTGILTGLCGYIEDNILLAVAAGAFINGMAGEEAQKDFGEIGMVSSDTINNIAKVIKSLM